MAIYTTQSTTTIPRCYDTSGNPVVVPAGTVVTTPWYPEGVYDPSPAQGDTNWRKNLAQNTNSTQQPGLL